MGYDYQYEGLADRPLRTRQDSMAKFYVTRTVTQTAEVEAPTAELAEQVAACGDRIEWVTEDECEGPLQVAPAHNCSQWGCPADELFCPYCLPEGSEERLAAEARREQARRREAAEEHAEFRIKEMKEEG